MDALKKIQAGADKARAKLAKAGLREYVVILRQRTATGKDPLLGTTGTVVSVDTTIQPPPKVDNVSARLITASSGVILMGDVRVSQISRHADYEALINDPETTWIITGPGSFAGEYSLVGGTLVRHNAEWVAVLRRRLQ